MAEKRKMTEVDATQLLLDTIREHSDMKDTRAEIHKTLVEMQAQNNAALINLEADVKAALSAQEAKLSRFAWILLVGVLGLLFAGIKGWV